MFVPFSSCSCFHCIDWFAGQYMYTSTVFKQQSLTQILFVFNDFSCTIFLNATLFFYVYIFHIDFERFGYEKSRCHDVAAIICPSRFHVGSGVGGGCVGVGSGDGNDGMRWFLITELIWNVDWIEKWQPILLAPALFRLFRCQFDAIYTWHSLNIARPYRPHSFYVLHAIYIKYAHRLELLTGGWHWLCTKHKIH